MIPSGLFDPLIDACDGALTGVLEKGEVGRAAVGGDHHAMANALLAADAFVTWAFEAAADDPATISARADAAMRRISDRAVTFLDPR